MAAVARERGARWNTLLLAESFLPVAEVRERLVEATRRPAAEDRAEAWPLLIRNAARSGDSAAVTSVLEEMGRLRNEQDPVRSAALHALSGVRPALFTEDAEPHLDRIAADAVEARDSSPGTRQNLSRLALAVLREHAAGGRRELVNWALRTLVRIIRQHRRRRPRPTRREAAPRPGAPGVRGAAPLDRGGRREVRLQPRLRARPRRGTPRRGHARAAGTPVAGHPVRQRRAPCAARSSCGWSRPRPGTSGWRASSRSNRPRARCGPSGRSSPGAAPICSTCCWPTPRRTGAFSPRARPGPCRWTGTYGAGYPRQQARWPGSWQRRPRTPGCRCTSGPPPSRGARSSRTRAPISYVTGRVPRTWCSPKRPSAALARTDRPADALPELLAHAGDDRARVAVYAATQASRYAAPSRLAEQLRAVLLAPRAKVTSRKEAARLAATRLPMPRAAALLTEAYAAPGAHVDVRAAVCGLRGRRCSPRKRSGDCCATPPAPNRCSAPPSCGSRPWTCRNPTASGTPVWSATCAPPTTRQTADPRLRRPGPLGALVPGRPDGPRRGHRRPDATHELARGGRAAW